MQRSFNLLESINLWGKLREFLPENPQQNIYTAIGSFRKGRLLLSRFSLCLRTFECTISVGSVHNVLLVMFQKISVIMYKQIIRLATLSIIDNPLHFFLQFKAREFLIN